MTNIIDVNVGNKPIIEVMRINGKLEKINIKIKYLIPVIVKTIIKDNRIVQTSIIDDGIKYRLLDNQTDRCMNTLDAWGEHRLIF